MIGIFVFGLGAVSFFVSILVGLALTLIGFAVSRKRELACSPVKVWILTLLSTVVVLVIILSQTVSVSSGGAPTPERYGEMAEAVAIWALVPGASLSIAGIALLTIRSKKSDAEQEAG